MFEILFVVCALAWFAAGMVLGWELGVLLEARRNRKRARPEP